MHGLPNLKICIAKLIIYISLHIINHKQFSFPKTYSFRMCPNTECVLRQKGTNITRGCIHQNEPSGSSALFLYNELLCSQWYSYMCKTCTHSTRVYREELLLTLNRTTFRDAL